MAGETLITVVGNLTADPELRHTQGGHAVASFTVASTPREFDRQANEWKDGDALFLRCSAWRDLGEHIAGSLAKGARVIVQGYLEQQEWTDRQSGEKRTGYQLNVQELGPSLRYATATVQRVQGGQRGAGQAGQQRGAQGQWGASQGQVPASWQQQEQPAGAAAEPWGSYDDETPF